MTPRRAMTLAWVLAVITAVLLFAGLVYYAGMTTLFAGLLAGWAIGRRRS